MTGRELAKQLNVSERTVQRDMAALKAAGVPIYALRGSGGGWLLEGAGRTQPFAFNERASGESLTAQARTIGDPHLDATGQQETLQNLVAAMSLRDKAESIRQRLYVDTTDWRGTSEDLSMLPIVQDAIARDRKLTFHYWRGGHQRVERTVDPLGLVAKGSVWYLVAMTPEGFRTYRVSRIEGATVLDEPGNRPADFDLAAHWKASVRRFQDGLPRYFATLRLEPRAANWIRMWRTAATVQDLENSSTGEWITLKVQFDNEEEACFVVLGLGTRAEVLEPAGLRERVADDAALGMSTSFEDMDGNSFTPVGFDELFRELESQRRAAAKKLESEQRAARELEIAKQVQARLFPQTLPQLRTLDYAGICIQALEVGGDYYDFLDLGRDRLALVVGDISGKGIAAALLMANLQANLRSQCATALDQPHRLLRSVNQLFYENTSDSAYATLFFAVYDDGVQRLRFANCGHLSALLLRSDSTLERFNSTCTVLGLFKEWDCSIEECRLSPGDTLALYTDGITESFNESGEEFGEQRLIEALVRNRGLSPQALLSSIVDEVRRFSPQQHDDITLIIARCRENCINRCS